MDTKLYNKDSKIGFIITYQTPNSDWGDEVVDRSSWAELTREICNKWDIPYLDLYDGVVYENGEVKTYSEILKVDTGNVVAFSPTVSYEIEMVHGFGNILFGGEGLFHTKLVGPGKVIVQSQNFREFANKIIPYIPTNRGN